MIAAQAGARPGIRVSLQNPPVIRVGGRLSRSLYQYTLQSPDAPELYRNAAFFEERLRALPDFRDVGSDLQLKNPQLKVVIDRASTMGITAQGDLPAPGRGSILERLRDPAGLDDQYAEQSISGDRRDRSEVPERSVGAVACSIFARPPIKPPRPSRWFRWARWRALIHSRAAFREPFGAIAFGRRSLSICAKECRSATPSRRSISSRARPCLRPSAQTFKARRRNFNNPLRVCGCS